MECIGITSARDNSELKPTLYPGRNDRNKCHCKNMNNAGSQSPFNTLTWPMQKAIRLWRMTDSAAVPDESLLDQTNTCCSLVT